MKTNVKKSFCAAFDEWSVSTVMCELVGGQRCCALALIGGMPATVLAVHVDSRFPAARLYELCDQAAARYGLPQRIWTDCGPEGMSQHLKQWGLANCVAISHQAGHSHARSKACLQFEHWLGRTFLRLGAFESVEQCKRVIEQSLIGHNSLLVRSARRGHADSKLFSRAQRTPGDSRAERSLRCLAPDELTEVDWTPIDVAHVMRHAAPSERQPAMTSPESDQHTLDEDAGHGN